MGNNLFRSRWGWRRHSRYPIYLLYWYKSTQFTRFTSIKFFFALVGVGGGIIGTQFTRFTGTKVYILTQQPLHSRRALGFGVERVGALPAQESYIQSFRGGAGVAAVVDKCVSSLADVISSLRPHILVACRRQVRLLARRLVPTVSLTYAHVCSRMLT